MVIDKRPVAPQPNAQAIEVISPQRHLTDSEVAALNYAVSERFMEEQGWIVEMNGR